MKVLLLGLLTWLIPFVVSIPFVNPEGGYWISTGLFKSIMLLVGCSCGLWLLLALLARNRELSATRVTLIWLLLNWFLDAVVLLPLSGMPVHQYASEIGIRYLMIPMVGYAIDVAKGHRTFASDSERLDSALS